MHAVTTIGVDEAGRGCVIGPLVVAGARGTPSQLTQLDEMGNLDSKVHSPAQRQLLLKRVQALGLRMQAVEIEPYCQHVLHQRQKDGCLPWFPIFDDVTKFDGRRYRGLADIVCGGFP